MDDVLVYVILGMSLLYAVFLLFLYRKQRRQIGRIIEEFEQEKKNIQEEALSHVLNKQVQYEALQSQINPHFLYNTLDSIRGEALIQGNESIAAMTERLSRFFRYCISNKGNIATIRDEINNVLDYFYIQEYRFGEKFKLEMDVEDSCYGYRIPQMTLQPIVENAIFHGLERQKDGGAVRISIFETEKNVHIEISDNGAGMEETVLKEINDRLRRSDITNGRPPSDRRGGGIALQNVNDRIKLHYGKDYGIVLRSTRFLGTDVELLIPRVSADG